MAALRALFAHSMIYEQALCMWDGLLAQCVQEIAQLMSSEHSATFFKDKNQFVISPPTYLIECVFKYCINPKHNVSLPLSSVLGGDLR